MFSHEAFETAELVATDRGPAPPIGVSLATRRYRDKFFEVVHITAQGAEVSLRGLYGTCKAANSALVSILNHVHMDSDTPAEEAITRLYRR